MLILTRKKGQSIIINNSIEIMISSIEGDQIKLGIVAPKEVNILRKEVFEAVKQSNQEAAKVQFSLSDLKDLTQSK